MTKRVTEEPELVSFEMTREQSDAIVGVLRDLQCFVPTEDRERFEALIELLRWP